MNLRIRSILAISIIAVVLAACSTAVGAPALPSQPAAPSQPASPSQPAAPSEPAAPSQPASPSADPSVAPSEPEAPADEEREIAGTITIYPGTWSGPGGTIQEALDNGPDSELPTLVNGVLFLDLDGRIYLATAVSDETAPTFEGPMLEVLGLDNTGESWDMDNADLLGLQEANGIVFNPNTQILGILEIS